MAGIPLLFSEVRVSAAGKAPVLLLREATGPRFLPVWVTATAAADVLSALESPSTSHPPTHDLFVETLSVLDALIEAVEIYDEEEGVFSARMRVNGNVMACRVSDAVALALRTGVQITCPEELLARLSVTALGDEDAGRLGNADDQVEQFREFLDSVSPDDFTSEP